MPGTRNNLYYIGAGKQSVFGTSVSPTWYWRWLDGTDLNPDAKISTEREGDGSPHINLMYKTSQYWMIKVKEYARPQTVGYALQALLGTGSDVYTAPTKSTTLAAGITAGASTFQSTADLGNVGNLAINFTPGYSSTTYEVQTVNLTTRTGTGPWTYTLASSATFKNNHSNSDVITSASTHTFTRGLTTYDPYTIEGAYYQSGFGKAIRVSDCVCYQAVLTLETGKPAIIEHDWYGTLGTVQASLASPTFEGTSVIGSPGAPFHYFQGGSSWTVDSLTTGNAPYIKKLVVTMKNSTAVDDFQTEALNPTYFIPGNFDVTGQMDVVFTDYRQYAETYMNTTSLATNSTDNYIMGYGQASVTLTADAVNSLAVSLPNVGYTAAKLAAPKLDGKALMQSVSWTAQKTAAVANPITLILGNSANAQY